MTKTMKRKKNCKDDGGGDDGSLKCCWKTRAWGGNVLHDTGDDGDDDDRHREHDDY